MWKEKFPGPLLDAPRAAADDGCTVSSWRQVSVAVANCQLTFAIASPKTQLRSTSNSSSTRPRRLRLLCLSPRSKVKERNLRRKTVPRPRRKRLAYFSRACAFLTWTLPPFHPLHHLLLRLFCQFSPLSLLLRLVLSEQPLLTQWPPSLVSATLPCGLRSALSLSTALSSTLSDATRPRPRYVVEVNWKLSRSSSSSQVCRRLCHG